MDIYVTKDNYSEAEGFCLTEAGFKVMPEPSELTKLTGAIKDGLLRASGEGVREVILPPVPECSLTSTLFQACSMTYKTIFEFGKEHGLPEKVAIPCSDDEIYKIYMVVWNMFYAGTKNQRMNDGRWD